MGLGAFGSGREDRLDVRTVSSNTTTVGDDVVLVDATNHNVTITLASDDAIEGNVVSVKDSTGGAGGNPITIVTEGSESIDGDTQYFLGAAREGISFVSDGTNWFVENNITDAVDMVTADPRNPSIGDLWFRLDLA